MSHSSNPSGTVDAGDAITFTETGGGCTGATFKLVHTATNSLVSSVKL